jgi:hypothetical protein
LAWNVVPTLTADSAEQRAQLALVCQQSTSLIDGYLHQPVRAVCVTEQQQFPGHPRASMDRHTGILTVVTRQWPVIAVNAVQVSEARSFPPNWSLVAQDKARIRTPVLIPASGDMVTSPSGGNLIDVAPGSIGGSRGCGRGQWLLSTSYTSGYPHTILTGSADDNGQSLTVGDVTGWPGWSGWVLDGPATEPVTVTGVTATNPPQLPGNGGSVQAGPGTLALAEPLAFPHSKGALVTALPLAVLQAAALKAAVIALETIAAIAVQSSGGQLPGGLGALAFEAEAALDPFVRVM